MLLLVRLLPLIAICAAAGAEWRQGTYSHLASGKIQVHFEYTSEGAPDGETDIATATNPWLRITINTTLDLTFGAHARWWVGIGLFSTIDAARNNMEPSMFNVDSIFALFNKTTGECQIIDATLYNKLPTPDVDLPQLRCQNNIVTSKCLRTSDGHSIFQFYRRASTSDPCDTDLQPGFNFLQYAYGPQATAFIDHKWSHRGNHSKQLETVIPFGLGLVIDNANATGGLAVQRTGPSPVAGGAPATPSNPWIYFEASWNVTATNAHWFSYSFLPAGTLNATMKGADAITLVYHPTTGCSVTDAYLYKKGPPNTDTQQNSACSENAFLGACTYDGSYLRIGAWRQAITNDTLCDFEIKGAAAYQWAYGPVPNDGSQWFGKGWFHHKQHSHGTLETISFEFV